jgi:hypothetical protein
MTTHSLWFQLATFLFYWAGIVAFVIGLLTVLAPGLVIRAGSVMNRWVSTERLFHDLDSPRHSERVFYRHHRIFGCLLAVGAAYVIYSFAFQFDAEAMTRRLVLFGSRSVTGWMFQSLAALNVLFGMAALGIGLAVFFRPSALKRMEAATNRWFAVDLKRLDTEVGGAERMFSRRPRLVGLVVMAASLYVVLSLRFFLNG